MRFAIWCARVVAGTRGQALFKANSCALEGPDARELGQTAAPGQSDSEDRLPNREAPGLRTDRDLRIRAAVKYAWTAVLGAQSYELDQRWSEADADSARAIELWLYIEQKLGFKLPLDALDEETTPTALAAAIADYLAYADIGRTGDGPDAPVVFLMPAIQSDDPPLARFRAAFGGKVRFKTLDYPEWRQMAAAGAGFDAIVDAVYSRICGDQHCEVYRLAGYSFGGLVAFEVAQRLKASGRQVEFLALLDSRRWDLTPPDESRKFHAFLGEPPSLLLDPVKRMVATLVRRRRYGLIGALEQLLMLRPSKAAFWFRRQVTKEMRYRALRQWKPALLDVPTVLFLSDDKWPGEPDSHGWPDVCSKLVTVHTGGTHEAMLQPPRCESLCSKFLEELQSAGLTRPDNRAAAL